MVRKKPHSPKPHPTGLGERIWNRGSQPGCCRINRPCGKPQHVRMRMYTCIIYIYISACVGLFDCEDRDRPWDYLYICWGYLYNRNLYPHRKEADPGRGLPHLRELCKEQRNSPHMERCFFQALCRGVFAPLFPTDSSC